MPRTPELLAPAGNWRNLQAALGAGADAVYFGVRGFNMRAGANNFSVRDLPRLVAACHAAGARAHLALNVLVLERELPRVRRVLVAAAKAGVDAVIASDLAVIGGALGLGLAVHASTQMSVANSDAVLALHALGVRRFVLARECSLLDIARLRRRLAAVLGASEAAAVQIEVFAHGAMCVSVSGRCFMSEHECGKSANRGECTQPCRREYRVTATRGDSEWVVGTDYVMSPRDLCTLPFLERLVGTGIDSLKIEGRLRSPEYVAIVVGAYRRALDFLSANKGRRGWLARWESLRTELLARVGEVYNRGFSSGFYHGRPIGEWARSEGSTATKRRQLVGTVLNFYRKPSIAHVAVKQVGLREGDELIIEGPTTGFLLLTLVSPQCEGQPTPVVAAGSELTFPTPGQVRPGDKVYVLR